MFNQILRKYSTFPKKHIGVDKKSLNEMLKVCSVESLNDLINSATFRDKENLYLPKTFNEHKTLNNFSKMINKNKEHKSMIGLGYHNTILPFPIKRHILENPKWYTSYTPYQAEISQGRLESQYNYQVLIQELTGLPIANASLLDEGSAGAEVLNLCNNFYKKKRNVFIINNDIHPQNIEILEYKAKMLGLNLLKFNFNEIDSNNLELDNVCGIMFQYPNTYGNINFYEDIIDKCKQNNVLVSASCDLLSLVRLKSPKELGIDIAFGNSQRFGVPLWFGGPHPAYFAVREDLIRFLPGRIIGKSTDINGKEGYRLGLQTREQHIRKDKATSNICTSQSLLTNVVSMYSLYHGKKGLAKIYDKIHLLAKQLEKGLHNIGIDQVNKHYFDSLLIEDPKCNQYYEKLLENNILVRKISDNSLVINLDEKTSFNDVLNIIDVIDQIKSNNKTYYISGNSDLLVCNKEIHIDNFKLYRNNNFMNQDIFNNYNTETNLVRYIYKLCQKDYTLCEGMIPLGSCTMKLTASSELEPLSFNKLTDVHPYVPKEYSIGYQEMIKQVGDYLKNITGFDAVSFMSNSGSMGEYLGLLVIRKHFEKLGLEKKNTILIPNSAHGTNFASCNMANLKIIKFDDNIDLIEFEKLVEKNKDIIAGLMITYPGTNGVFQKNIKEICSIIHKYNGLVYMDGANMNAQVGITNPKNEGADMCHLNLHKTFCIPHGGGGPGMGPLLVTKELEQYLPVNDLQVLDCNTNKEDRVGLITSSQWSSASILSIVHMYISLMGEDGLRQASKIAILNANYLKESLKDYYTIKDVNENGRVAHEFIIDTYEFKKIGLTDVDISKRLMDYSFHPPTMSWPRTNVLMFEPTESESKEELDRLIRALISIRNEIKEIEDDLVDKNNNLLKNAPHNFDSVLEWNYPYSIEKAFYPLPELKEWKFNIPIGRIDDIEGDKKLLGRKK